MKRSLFILFVVLTVPLFGWGQAQHVEIGRYRFVPDRNIEPSHRTTRSAGAVLDLPEAVNGWRNVLVQFDGVPSAADHEAFASRGLRLGAYVNGNAYMAQLREDVDPRRAFAGSDLLSVMAVEPEWKLAPELYDGRVPEHARVGSAGVSLVVHLEENAPYDQVASVLKGLGGADISVYPDLGLAQLTLPAYRLEHLASEPYVSSVMASPKERELLNRGGVSLHRATRVRAGVDVGGRALTGKGVNVGLWDGNVVSHPDFGDRVTRKEFEIGGVGARHGTHTMGSIVGSGMVDPLAAGNAPQARAYTYNFNMQRNRKLAPIEMHEAYKQQGIQMSSNSYGTYINCGIYEERGYPYGGEDQLLDMVAFSDPYLTIVFAVGNDQDKCPELMTRIWGAPGYGTTTTATKNSILVGALKADGTMSEYSSWGPRGDGRMAAHVCTRGSAVYSTSFSGDYMYMTGTSMACPNAAGAIVLLQERWMQLHPGTMIRSDLVRALVSNSAHDAGIKGPDFEFGYGILDIAQAIEDMEKNQFSIDTVSKGKSKRTAIRVPNGVKALKVLVAWNDPAAEHKPGFKESVLVNDLDLKVEGVKPLTPNPLRPMHPARPSVDKVNNIEQVVIENPTPGYYFAEVVGTDVKSKAQLYALTWHFDYGTLEVDGPMSGEAVEPGEEFYVRLDGISSPYRVFMSWDGGKSYREIGGVDRYVAGDPRMENLLVTCPADAAVTSEARLRVVTADNRIVDAPNTFAIAGRPVGVTLTTDSPCGDGAAKLSWTAPELGAGDNGYSVLKGDPVSGTFKEIGKTAVGVTEFTIPADDYKTGMVYTVAVRVDAEGSVRGTRAHGVISRQPARTTMVVGALGEDVSKAIGFNDMGSGPYRISEAKNVFAGHFTATNLLPQLFPLESGYVYFHARDALVKSVTEGTGKDQKYVVKPLEGFSLEEPFAKADHVNRVTLCGLDLTAYADKRILVTVPMFSRPQTVIQTPYVRLLQGDEPVKNVLGEDFYAPKKGALDGMWLVEGGSVQSLTLEVVVPFNDDGTAKRGDQLLVFGFILDSEPVDPDVRVDFETVPESKSSMGVESIVTVVKNNHAHTIDVLPVELYVNNSLAERRVLRNLTMFKTDTVRFEYDFSSAAPYGEDFDVEVRAPYPGDIRPANNSAKARVENYGGVYALEQAHVHKLFGMTIPLDPQAEVTLEPGQRIIFTDHAGARKDYNEQTDLSSVRFKPSDPNLAVRATILEFDVYPYTPGSQDGSEREDGSMMRIYPNNTASLEIADRNKSMGVITLTGKGEGLPLEIVSNADNGSLCFSWLTMNRTGAGWVIMIEEAPRVEGLQLEFVGAPYLIQGQDPEGKFTAKLRVSNKLNRNVENVMVSVTGRKSPVSSSPVIVPANGVVEVDVPGIAIGMSSTVELKAVVTGDGASGASAKALAVYDSYPIPPAHKRWKPEGEFMSSSFFYLITPDGNRGHFTTPGFSFQQYKLRHVLYDFWDAKGNPKVIGQLYRGDGENGVILSAPHSNAHHLVMYADWEGDGKWTRLGEPFHTDAGGVYGGGRENIYIPMTGLSEDTPLGIKRFRAILGPLDEIMDPNFTGMNSREYGLVQDFHMEVIEGFSPRNYDLSISDAYLVGNGREDKLREEYGLTEMGEILGKGAVQVCVEVQTGHSSPYAGTLSLGLGYAGRKLSDVVNASEEPIPAAYSGVRRFYLDLPESMKLNEIGSHELKLSVVDMTDPNGTISGDPENNEKAVRIHVHADDPSGEYALHFQSLHADIRDVRDSVYLYEGGSVEKAFSLEFWFMPDASQDAILLWNDREQVRITRNSRFADVLPPDNALMVLMGGKAYAYTGKNTIVPGAWNHVALVFDGAMSGSSWDASFRVSDLQIYINGEQVPYVLEGVLAQGTVDSFHRLYAGYRYNGFMDEVRFWNKKLSKDEIVAGMYKHVEEAQAKDLRYNFSFNEGVHMPTLSGEPNANEDKVTSVTIGSSPMRLAAYEQGGMWLNQLAQNPIRQFELAGAEEYTITKSESGYEVSVVMDASKSLNAVNGSVKGLWPDVKISLDGSELRDGVISGADLSSGSSTLEFKRELWGEERTWSVDLKVKSATGSSEAKLVKLTFAKADNEGLAEDVVFDAPGQVICLDKAVDNPGLVSIQVEVSPGAQVRFNGVDLTDSKFTVDLTRGALLQVISENGYQSTVYSLTYRLPQKITLALDKTSFIYGDKPVKVKAESDSGLPVTVLASEGGVVSVAKDADSLILNIIGAGEVDLIATQLGDATHAAAQPKRVRVKVARAQAKVTPVVSGPDGPLQYARAIYFDYDYEGLVHGQDYYTLPDAQEIVDWKFVAADGTVYSEDDLQPLGEYTLVPTTKTYETANYTITAVDGHAVMQGHPVGTNIEVYILEEDGCTPIAGAQLTFGNSRRFSSEQGIVRIPAGGTYYDITVSKDGYQTYRTRVHRDEQSKTQRVDVRLRKVSFTVSYKAGANGIILGEASQGVALGSTTSPVVAFPDAGYCFVSWDDGIQDAERTDGPVTGDLSVEASFDKEQLVLRYAVDEGGAFEGESGSIVEKSGVVGTEFTVKVKAMTDTHYFVGWSDGVVTPERTDKIERAGVKLVAHYAPYQTIPAREDFASGDMSELPTGWLGTNRIDQSSSFARVSTLSSGWNPIHTENIYHGDLDRTFKVMLFDHFLYLSMGKQDNAGEFEVSSPLYAVSGVSEDLVLIHYLWFVNGTRELTLQYRVAGGDWTDFATPVNYEHSEGYKKYSFTVPQSAFAGKLWIQFRFLYKLSDASKASAGGFAVDDFGVYLKSLTEKKVHLTYRAEPAEGGFFTHYLADGTEEKKSSFDLAFGDLSPVVRASENTDYTFKVWKDGSKQAKRDLPVPVYVDADHVAFYYKDKSYLVRYTTTPAGSGRVELDGKAVDHQLVAEGENAKAVTAKANDGYEFVKWSNGTLEAEMVQTNVSAHTNLIATFRPYVAKHDVPVTVSRSVVHRGQRANVPAAGALIHVMRGSERVDMVAADKNGKVTLKLADGQYTISASVQDLQSERVDITVAGAALSEIPLVVTEALDIYPVRFVVTDAQGSPVSSATVKMAELGDQQTAADGTLVLKLPYGRIDYTVLADGYIPVDGNYAVSRSEGQEIKIVLTKGVIVKFTVVREHDGLPVAGALVHIGASRAETDAQGQVSITVTPGSLTYYVERAGYVPSEGVQVNVAAGSAEVYEIRLKQILYPVTITVLGTQADGTTKPLEGVEVLLLELPGIQPVLTDASGVATLQVPAGDQQFRIGKPGWSTEYDYIGLQTIPNIQGPTLYTFTLSRLAPTFNVVESTPFAGVTYRPNPVVDDLILGHVEEVERVSVYSLYGALVTAYDLRGESELRVDLRGVASGVYVVRLEGEAGVRSIRVIKQ